MATTNVGDIELYYEEHGSGDPLLCIMGLAADSAAWMFQVPDFSKQYRTIIFDNRGVGRSSKPAGPYTTAQMASDAVGLLDALGIQQANVLGVSMGGMIAQELALGYPQRVKRLVLACTYAEPDGTVEQQRKSSVAQLGGTIGPDGQIEVDMAKLNPMDFFQQLLPLSFNPEFIANDLPKLMQMFMGSLQYGISLEGIMAQVAAVTTHRTTDRLGQIKSPTLVIAGDNDRLVPPENSDVLAKHIPGAKLVKIAGGSHGFNFETPELFNKEILAFLA